jgi:glycosyltransferase involved in cell wall biosynthesis
MVHDHRFVEKDGVVYSNQFPASVLSRYLGVFKSLTFVGRKQDGDRAGKEGLPVSSMLGVEFVFMPNISTPKSFLRTRQAVRAKIADLLRTHDRLIVRLPSELGLLAAAIAQKMGRGYAVELVGCPWDSLWYYGTLAARLYAPLQARRSRIAVRKAGVVTYVTKNYLQRRYPAAASAITISFSDVAISSTVDPNQIVTAAAPDKRIRIGIIGSLRTRYKGVHSAIDAVARLVRNGADIELRILGSGDPKALLAQAEQHQIPDRVFFDGTLPAGAAVHGWLDQLDIYAQPSLTEGLPRALIEAMSRGLPAVASNVGGIPELLGADYLFQPDDPVALADRLKTLIISPSRRAYAGRANVEKAAGYQSVILDARRTDFLRVVKNGAVKHCESCDSASGSGMSNSLMNQHEIAARLPLQTSTSELVKAKLMISINSSWNFINFRAGLVKSFVDQGYEVVAVAPHDEYASRLSTLGCRYIPLSMDNKGTHPGRDFVLLWRFFHLLRKERPNVFLGYTVKPNIYGSLAAHALRIPVVNNIAGLGAVFIKQNMLTRLVKNLYLRALSRSEKVFFQNEDDRRLFTEGGLVRAEVTDRLPGSGIDLTRFAPVPLPDSSELKGLRFLLIARMLWDKGVGEYVEAARRVRQRHPDAEFCLLGFLDVQNPTAITRDQMDQWVAGGAVRYLGTADDVRPHIAEADCMVLPSYYREGVPRTLLEAAAMGRPIVTTDAVGCREVVNDGVNGYLCKPRDAEDLAAKMEQMIGLSQEERSRMGQMGREKMEREFDERIVVRKYLEIVEKIISANK